MQPAGPIHARTSRADLRNRISVHCKRLSHQLVAISLKVLHQGFESRVRPDRRKVRIIFHPLYVAEALTKGLFQAVDGLICFLKQRIVAGDVVKDRCFLGVHGQRPI